MSTIPLKITCDASEFNRAIQTVNRLREFSPEIISQSLGECDSVSDLATLNCDDGSATGTRQIRVLVQPSERLKSLVATLREKHENLLMVIGDHY
ncbi:MAG: hypothetical protein K1Y36_10470 [Blastocatellia bacterium]|nr:hypothetical protein [Blastocatellia bacterium]